MSSTGQEWFPGVGISFVFLKLPSYIFPLKYSIVHDFFLLFLTF